MTNKCCIHSISIHSYCDLLQKCPGLNEVQWHRGRRAILPFPTPLNFSHQFKNNSCQNVFSEKASTGREFSPSNSERLTLFIWSAVSIILNLFVWLVSTCKIVEKYVHINSLLFYEKICLILDAAT